MITNEVLLPNEQCPHIDQALETCIDGSHWDPMVGECATYMKEWKDLSKSERAAAPLTGSRAGAGGWRGER